MSRGDGVRGEQDDGLSGESGDEGVVTDDLFRIHKVMVLLEASGSTASQTWTQMHLQINPSDSKAACPIQKATASWTCSRDAEL